MYVGFLLQGVRKVQQPDLAHADTYGGEAVCLRDVQQGVLTIRQPDYSHADAYGREAVCLQDVL